MKPSRIIIAAAAIVVCVPAGIYGWNRTHVTHISSLERAMSLTDLSNEATLVISGTPVKASARTLQHPSAGPLLYTDWTVQISSVLKGSASGTVTVTVPGGERFGQRTIAENFDGLKKNTTYLMYLMYNPEMKTWTPLSITQGLFEKRAASFMDAAGHEVTPEAAASLITTATPSVTE